MNLPRPTLALSVDVEDWPQSSWDRRLPISDYCADNTRRLADLLAEFPEARATFFILGKFAERHPSVVRALHKAGHEIGSHGYGHEELFKIGCDKFAEDLRRSTAIIAEATGTRPTGYRAPDFSIVGESLWALDVLAEAGYLFDSSIFPIGKARYGIAGWPRHAVRVKLKSGATLVELPIATLEQWGRRLAIGGGGYARLMPAPLLVRVLRKACRQVRSPPVYYCHPYEIDAGEFRRLALPVPLKVRLHQGLGRSRTIGKLRRILKGFDCVCLGESIARAGDLPVLDYTPYVLESGAVERPPIFPID
jgi:polysaccharide deacetylase family protein (PEP-CTERM system associated)